MRGPGRAVSDMFNTLQVYLGSYYVNNFNEFGRTWQVNVQADGTFRDRRRRHRAAAGAQQPGTDGSAGHAADACATRSGPVVVLRYNMYSATAITGQPAPGTSSGQAVGTDEGGSPEELPQLDGVRVDRADVPATQAGNTALYVFGLAVVFVFLVLAAQYESWTLPLAIILVVPMCLLCSRRRRAARAAWR